MHYEQVDGRSELTLRIILASKESFGAGLTSGLQWNMMTSEVAGSCRFEGTAFPNDPTDLFLDFEGVWVCSGDKSMWCM